MTREEAKREILFAKREVMADSWIDKAYDVAIKALEQPEQPSEIQDILDYLDTALHPIISPEHWNVYSELHDMISTLPSAQPEQRWIPVTKDTLPEEGKVVIVKGTKGTWDVGMYRGYGHFHGEERIHIWNWKKNTTKRVYWWMYKDGALPDPYGGEQDGD